MTLTDGRTDLTYAPPLTVIAYRGGMLLVGGTTGAGFNATGNLADGTAAADTDSAPLNGMPWDENAKLASFVSNIGVTDGVSRDAPMLPTPTLTALASPGRNPADITISILTGGGGGDGSHEEEWSAQTVGDLETITFSDDGPKDYGMTPDHDKPIHPPKPTEYIWRTAAAAYLAQHNAAVAAGLDVLGAGAEGLVIHKGWADRKSNEMAPLLSARWKTRLEQKDVQNALQHAYWLALMYILYGEKDAREIAWLHEKYASDGWLDTLRDFYNNNRGIEIGKAVEKLLGADTVKRLREGPGEQLGGIGPNPIAASEDLNRARQLIEQKVIEALEQGKLVIALSEVKDNPRVMPDVMKDAQRFWDATVYYIPFADNERLQRGTQLKPTQRPSP